MKIFRGISLLDLDIHRKFSLRGNWSLIHILINHTSNIKTCVGESLHTLLMPIAIQMFFGITSNIKQGVFYKSLCEKLNALPYCAAKVHLRFT